MDNYPKMRGERGSGDHQLSQHRELWKVPKLLYETFKCQKHKVHLLANNSTTPLFKYLKWCILP